MFRQLNSCSYLCSGVDPTDISLFFFIPTFRKFTFLIVRFFILFFLPESYLEKFGKEGHIIENKLFFFNEKRLSIGYDKCSLGLLYIYIYRMSKWKYIKNKLPLRKNFSWPKMFLFFFILSKSQKLCSLVLKSCNLVYGPQHTNF